MGSLNPWLQAAPAQCVGRREPEASTGGFPAVNNIMPEPGRHGWAELLRLVGAVRRLACDRTLPPPEALGRIRDAYCDYDHSSQS
jgi:hypothetical protein